MTSEVKDTERFNEATTSFNRSQQTSPVSDILHYKCPLVKLVRRQINSLDDYEFISKNADGGALSSRYNAEALEQSPTSAKQTKQILALFLIAVSAAFTFIYGAYKGAEICSGAPGKCNVCYPVNLDVFKIPGLMSFHKSRNTY